jgi:hypothetical protein
MGKKVYEGWKAKGEEHANGRKRGRQEARKLGS